MPAASPPSRMNRGRTSCTAPTSGFMQMPFASASLGAEQPLLASELLGYGRDPLAPIKDAVTADGDITVPLDAEAFGFWLKAAFGAPTTTGTTNKTHTFKSGSWNLPSMAIEVAMPEIPRFAMYTGCVLDQRADVHDRRRLAAYRHRGAGGRCARSTGTRLPGSKVKIGKPHLAEDHARLAAVREAFGPDCEIMVDANQSFSLSEAKRRAAMLESLDIAWFEEPMPADDVASHATLAAGTSVPVVVGESLYAPSHFKDYLGLGGASIVQVDVARVGGITP